MSRPGKRLLLEIVDIDNVCEELRRRSVRRFVRIGEAGSVLDRFVRLVPAVVQIDEELRDLSRSSVVFAAGVPQRWVNGVNGGRSARLDKPAWGKG